MIDQNELDRVRRVIGDMMDLAPPVPEHPPASADNCAQSTFSVSQRVVVTIAAVAVGLAGLAGVVLVADRGSPTTPTDAVQVLDQAPTAVVPQPLETADQLDVSDWAIASVLPNDEEFLYARRENPPDSDQRLRTVAYGQLDGDGTAVEELLIGVGGVRGGLSDEIITLAGVEWSVGSLSGGWWSATRALGETYLTVHGTGEVDEAVLGGLLVVDETGLPFVPLGGPDDAAVVARAELGDEVYSYAVQESGRGTCNWVTTSTGTSGGCGLGALPADAVITIAGHQTTYPDDATSIDAADVELHAASWGSVTSDVALVEVEFADGTVVAIEPTDRSGTFDKRFWIAAATVDNGSHTGSDIAEAGVTEARAYDADGNHLGSAVPPWLDHPDAEQ